jgi:hypothetical protein
MPVIPPGTSAYSVARASLLEHDYAVGHRRLEFFNALRGRPSAAAALAGNTWAGSPWRPAGLIAGGEASITLRSLTPTLPLLQFLGGLPLLAAQFGDQRAPGSMVTSRSALLLCGAPCHGADPNPADHAIQPRSPVGGHGIGGECFGRLTTARSRLRACDI